MLKFVRPDLYFRNEYKDMMDEWIDEGGKIAPWPLALNYKTDNDFEKMVREINNASLGINIGEFAPCTTFWVMNDDTNKIIGAVNIRHYLTQVGLKTWGHIGYGVRPSERKKGLATQILKMALEKCREMNMTKVLLGCLESNIGSSKVIENNGGILESLVSDEESEENIKRYWIRL